MLEQEGHLTFERVTRMEECDFAFMHVYLALMMPLEHDIAYDGLISHFWGEAAGNFIGHDIYD